MTVLCALPPGDTATLPRAAEPLARALGLSLAATALFDAAASADPANPADVEAARAAAEADLAALLPPGVASAGLSLRLNGEPPWSPPVRLAIATAPRLLAVDARETPWLGDLGRAVRAAPVPVLAIGPRYAGPAPTPVRILALADGSPESAAVAPALARLLGDAAVPVELLAVAVPAVGERPEERELDLAAALQALERGLSAPAAHRRVEPPRAFESVPAAALRVAAETGATHLALATHGRGRAMRFLLGSVAEALLRTSPLPLIVTAPGGTDAAGR
ncbi:MAG: hypothetical protein KatS3mg064_2737 [Tepidiforma sp.]|nr:universal stress protein [Tepidiforma sp.]GIW19580.1 MAG: hypothetical protein KatS3mg064_2737 [Tepidiforma sp.]